MSQNDNNNGVFCQRLLTQLVSRYSQTAEGDEELKTVTLY